MRKGFVLLELILSLALLSILFGGSLLAYSGVASRSDLTIDARSSRALLEEASRNARAGADDDHWGVHFESGQATLFKGVSFSERVPAYDEVVNLYVDVSGTVEYIFQKTLARPDAAGVTVFTAPQTGGQITVSVNTYGTIESY